MLRAHVATLSLVTVLMGLGNVGCGTNRGTVNDPLDVHFSDTPESIEFSTGLADIDFEEGHDFDFCPFATDLNLANAAWLSYLAANQYAHFGELGPLLEGLGFGEEGEGQRWAGCARDLYALRSLEDNEALPETFDSTAVQAWGDCVRNWVLTRVGADDRARPTSVAAAFEYHLIQEAHPGGSIQFFSGGEFEVDETSFEAGTTQVMWARHREMPLAVIAFRGTEVRRGQLLHDAMCDISFGMEAVEGWGRIHRGFRGGLDAVDNGLLSVKLEELEGSGAVIWVTGHSLGAALATLLTARILYEIDRGADLTLGGLYTFGSPRVGDHEFAEIFDRTAQRQGIATFRFRHGNDVVTRIPLSSRRIEYEHVGRLVLLSRDGEMTLEPDRVPRGLYRFFSDHSSTGYYERIRHLANDPENAQYVQCRR